MDGLQDDAGDGSMQCPDHPFQNNTPAGGICAICLQEKLGKLVSSSFPITVFPSSSSSSPSFRSDITTNTATVPPQLTSSSNTQISPNTTTNCHHQQYYSNRSRILYLIGQKKKKKKDLNIIIDGGDGNKNLVYKRSKSTTTPHRSLHYMDAENDDGLTLTSPHKRGFWSLISKSSARKTLRDISSNSLCASTIRARNEREIIVVKENESPCTQPSFDRKVSRSRSVGCGSRSFSGDFFERISTGFGDCTLRRVESQREGKSKHAALRTGGPERVRCGGLFSGFMITSSSSSLSSSSYWIASNPKVTSAVAGTGTDHGQQYSRHRSWGWSVASPMRAFSKPSSIKREAANPKVTSAILHCCL